MSAAIRPRTNAEARARLRASHPGAAGVKPLQDYHAEIE